MDVGVDFGQPICAHPVRTAHPAVSAVGRLPDVDASDHHHIGLCGVSSDAEVIPALARIVISRCGVSQHVRGAFGGYSGPCGAGILAHIKSKEGASFAVAGHHVNAVGSAWGHGDAVAVHALRFCGQAHFGPRLSTVGRTEKPGVGGSIYDVGVGGVELYVSEARVAGARSVTPVGTGIGGDEHAVPCRCHDEVAVVGGDQNPSGGEVGLAYRVVGDGPVVASVGGF